MSHQKLSHSHRLAATGSTFVMVDGVPFHITEKFIPPKKVSLPIQLDTGNPSEILFMEYEPELEMRVIKWAEEERLAETQRLEQQRAKQLLQKKAAEAAAEAKAAADLENKQVGNVATDDNDETDASGKSGPASTLPFPPSTKMVTSSSNGILVPTLISQSSGATGVGTKSVGGAGGGAIDLTDFENEQDPFENLSLRVINDREELGKVFTSQAAGHLAASGSSTASAPGLDTTVTDGSGIQTTIASVPLMAAGGSQQGTAPPLPPLAEQCRVETVTSRSTGEHSVIFQNDKTRYSKAAVPENTPRTQQVTRLTSPAPSRGQETSSDASSPQEDRRREEVLRSMLEMGFDAVCSNLAVERYGSDEKLVLDHLCSLVSLADKGFKVTDVQSALFSFNHNVAEAERFLEMSTKLSEFGFSPEQIKSALIESKLDQDKALDILMAQTVT